ncbi:hypothetical protein [Pseudomonas borbori]|uniref:Pyridoxamine 5'-phosphate oxidase putative domain-containing protein n=1 Tax=Pseudomonas borbori TaxID=289003 RepID=A0A1I5MSA6_9PSED|nr:hypothetical protein [Pseudomonas borbori]SFP12428.1 hypothetical protein SAMN05216190_10588 [Pseudomonas borbori]
MSGTSLSEEQVHFIESGVSISAASRDMRRVPSVSKVVGCRVAADRRQVTVLVDATQAGQLLQDVEGSKALAVVFCLPSSHRTLQLKGCDAHQVALAPGDAELAARHRDAFAADLLPLGYALPFARATHEFQVEQLRALCFTLSDLFEQTPGPNAGSRLEQE